MDPIAWFGHLSPLGQALVSACFTWSVTAMGAAVVFVVPAVNRRLLDSMLGFAAGVMIAASFWSLLAPAIAMAEEGPLPSWFPAVTGFLLGGVFLWTADRLLPHLHPGFPIERAEGIPTGWRRSVLLVLAVTLHNIPEGLAIGVAFGALEAGAAHASLSGAVALAIGMGIQNFPEGTAVSLPLRRDGMGRWRSFWYGQLSGAVEPLAAAAGVAAVALARPVLPYALAFAAGAMIYVVIEELIPEAQMDGETHSTTFGALAGFAVMMVLDTALG